MKFCLLIALCLITQITFASLPSVIKNDSLFIQQKMIFNGDDILSLPLNKSSLKHIKKTKGKTSFKKEVRFFINHILHKAEPHKSDFNLGGLLLGIFLGPVGVAIAYISSKNKSFRKWSVTGCVIDVGLGIIFILSVILIFGVF